MSAYLKPLPQIDDFNKPYWEAAKAGRLVVQKCLSCGEYRFPQARYCHACLSENSEWRDVSGRGTIWSYCIFHRAYFKGFEGELPYNVILVRLDEGPKMYSNLLGLPNEQIRIGMAVEACYVTVTDNVSLVKFRPV